MGDPRLQLATGPRHRPGRGYDPRAGGGGATAQGTPCSADPDAWFIDVSQGTDAATAQIRAAVRGCRTCQLARPAAYQGCLDRPRALRVPRTVEAGAVIDKNRERIDPSRYIARRLGYLRVRAQDRTEDPPTDQ